MRSTHSIPLLKLDSADDAADRVPAVPGAAVPGDRAGARCERGGEMRHWRAMQRWPILKEVFPAMEARRGSRQGRGREREGLREGGWEGEQWS